ncbi:YmfQ family protein [Roseomonas chloroacetimidivorans]|uniref:YmfQ family protein n=1 Tax=Roseomonas chloroacetimidivorans TaxID=1766656 RepID=UPI003C74A2A4
MAAIARTVAEYSVALLALLPRGRIWPRDPDATLAAVARGLAPSAQRLDGRAVALLTDAFPGTAYELLPEWEASLGLPDPCAGPSPSLQQRRAQVVARLTATGGQSVPYFIEVAANLGYGISVKEYAPARVGLLRAGDRLYGAAWAHAWAIQAPETTVTPFRAGQSAAGERLRTFGNDVLECQLRSLAPAHTVLLFQYV